MFKCNYASLSGINHMDETTFLLAITQVGGQYAFSTVDHCLPFSSNMNQAILFSFHWSYDKPPVWSMSKLHEITSIVRSKRLYALHLFNFRIIMGKYFVKPYAWFFLAKVTFIYLQTIYYAEFWTIFLWRIIFRPFLFPPCPFLLSFIK